MWKAPLGEHSRNNHCLCEKIKLWCKLRWFFLLVQSFSNVNEGQKQIFWMRRADKTDDLKRASYANPYKRVKGKYTNHYKTTWHWAGQSLRVTRWKCVTLYIWFCVWHDRNNKCHCNFEKDVIRKHSWMFQNILSQTFKVIFICCLKATLHKLVS